jgi:hypothetical protein
MLHKNANPNTESPEDAMTWEMKREAMQQAKPAAKNTGQILSVK